MGDCAEDSEDASSIADEERVRRLFQACDGDGDGFIDGQDLLNVCRELNLEDSLEELMKELGADEHGRISYQEFVRRRIALRPEIDALRSSRPPQPDYLPTSSDNSLGEGKMSWEFDSGARDLSPEPHSLQQLVSVSPHPASGNLLELANKLHLAALASLKGEILDLSNRLQFVTQERDILEKSLNKSELDRLKLEKKVEEDFQLHEEQLTELHSVIAELTRKVQHQRSMVIREEEDLSETDGEVSAGVECSQTLPPDEEGADVDATVDASSSNDEPSPKAEEVEEEEEEEETPQTLREQLEISKADNAMLQERLARALDDLETISKLNVKKSQPVAEAMPSVDVVKVARVSSPSRMVERSSPSLVPESILNQGRKSPMCHDNLPVAKLAERVRLKKVDNQVTGSDIAAFGVCHTKIAEHLVSDLQEESDLQEISRNEVSCKQYELENERLNAKLEHVKAQNTVLALTLEESKAQSDKLSLLLGKYESNAIALKLALNCSDEALAIAECLNRLLDTELGLVLANCRKSSNLSESEQGRLLRKATDSRRDAERYGKELLMKLDKCNLGNEWCPSDEKKLKECLGQYKHDRNTIKSTAVELESPQVEPVSAAGSVSEARKLDLETAVLMQELMSMREDKSELRARIQLLEKERATQELRVSAQSAHLQALLEAIHQLQTQMNEDRLNTLESSKVKESRLKERMEQLVGTLDKVAQNSELRHQQNTELVLDLRAANTALVSTLDRCKKKYLGRLKKLESQMMALVERHAEQVQTLKQRIIVLERNSNLRRLPESTI